MSEQEESKMEYVIETSNVAEKLRTLRKNKKMSVAAVAREIGISASALSMYEAGCRIPRDSIKIKLSNYYDKPIGELFYGQ